MMQYPKCRHCGHSKTKHVNQVSGKQLAISFCWDCYNFFTYGPIYEWEYNTGPAMNSGTFNYYHKYHPDNLSYIEKLAERRKLI